MQIRQGDGSGRGIDEGRTSDTNARKTLTTYVPGVCAEPTSGLDSETALGLMKLLVQLARKQRTVSPSL
jgi:hypothetical protein